MIERRGIAMWARVLAVALCLGGAHGARAEMPRRIVSVNLCTDQLALMLVDRARIQSVSFLAADPASSPMAAEARGLHLNHGLAEEILPLRPDIILAGPHGARQMIALMRHLRYRVVQLPLGNGLDDIAKHVRRIARALGAEAKGEALLDEFTRRLSALPGPAPGPRPRAVLIESSGVTSGAGTLPHAVMKKAGFENLAAQIGLRGVTRLPLEIIVQSRPDALIRGWLEPQYPSLAARLLTHPALARSVADGAGIDIPDNLWSCATPGVITAIERLARFRVSLAQGPVTQ
jgi:iron complex transport system substrate-binding protein